jgi:glutathione S-transferase
MARFVANWTDTVVHPGIARLIIADIFAILDPRDRDYFRKSREERFGAPLETIQADRDQRVVTFRQSLAPLRLTLEKQPFIGGDRPTYADYAVFGGFQWARSTSPFKLLETGDPVAAWRDRLLDAFDGLARASRGFAV